MQCYAFLLLLAVAAAKKTAEVDPDILNPEPESVDPKARTGEYNAGSKFVEGDMVVKGGDKNNRNAINDDKKLWPNAVVPFEIDSRLPQSVKDLIKRAMDDYHKYTCVRWQPRRSEKNYVFFNNRASGCYAYLGMYGGRQPVNLGRGCEVKGIAIHEMLHTLGFAHEQSRNDRDRYIRINWNNMHKGYRSQFEKMNNERNLGTAYDLKSVMHYGPWGFSSNGQRVIDTVDPSMKNVIGQRQGFSKTDAEEVNKLYRCSGSRPQPKFTTQEPVTFSGECKDAYGNYCYNLAVQYGYSKLCDSQMYSKIAAKSCPRYCKLC